MRDLLLALGHERATIVGHSLGGGVAMQFSYQFPERVERLALVSSGGLGREVHLMLRAATLPGADFVLPALARTGVLGAGAAAGALAARASALHPSPDVQRHRRRPRDARRRGRLPRLPAHRALDPRPRRPARQRERPALPRGRRAGADRLGRARSADPGRPRARRARADAAQPARDLRRRRPLPVRRRAAALRRTCSRASSTRASPRASTHPTSRRARDVATRAKTEQVA